MSGRYYGANYDQKETNYHHSDGRHEYRISRTVTSADVFINLPKIKTHKKVGVTLCLKNLVGINTGRNWLPHHTDGDPGNGGDQFPVATTRGRSERFGVRNLERLTNKHPKLFAPVYHMAKKAATPFFGHTRQTIRSGNWHGNDTCWRMVQDINRCLFYSDGRGLSDRAAEAVFFRRGWRCGGRVGWSRGSRPGRGGCIDRRVQSGIGRLRHGAVDGF